MSKVKLFEFSEYIAYMKVFFRQAKANGKTQSALAEAMQVQSAFVSQVLSGKNELSPDQAFRATQFFEHSEEESEYFLLLVQMARASDRDYKKSLKSKIEAIHEKRKDLKNRVQASSFLSPEHQAEYYSSWAYAALHIAASLKEKKSPSQHAENLGIAKDSADRVFRFLENLGLVKIEGGIVQMGPTHIHLAKQSPWVYSHHSTWRMKALNALSSEKAEDLHYSVVYSLSKKDAERLREKISTLIEENLKIVAPSEEEVLYVNTIDFFKV